MTLTINTPEGPRVSGWSDGNPMGPEERRRAEDARFREAYWRGIKDAEERERAALQENVRNASRERDRTVCRRAAELGVEGWQSWLLNERHAGGDQVVRPPLALGFVHSALAVLRDDKADATAKAGAAVIARAVVADFELLATTAGSDGKVEAKGALARIFGR